jgi:hypothetical protein
MGDAEEVWKAGKARKDTDLSAPTFTVADGLGGAEWGWGVKALESWKNWCENGVTGFWGWCRLGIREGWHAAELLRGGIVSWVGIFTGVISQKAVWGATPNLALMGWLTA